MKKFTLFFITAFSLLVALSAVKGFAQNVLVLTNPETQQKEIFRKGSYIVFGVRSDSSVHEGFIRSITDSSLVFDNAQVGISQIDILAGNSREHIPAQRTAETIGTILIVGGITALCIAASASSFHSTPHYHHVEFHPQVWVNLGYAINWGACPIDRSVHLRDYSKWKMSIVNEGQKISTPSEEKPIKEKKNQTEIEDDVYGK